MKIYTTDIADIADIESMLADFEGQLERFKPKIEYMESMPQPRRDFHSQAYLEKNRLQRNIQNFKDILKGMQKKEEWKK